MAKQPVKAPGKPAGKPGENKNPHSAGLTLRVPITNPLHKDIGDSNPDRLREINVLKNNAKDQLKWAEEEKKAADLLNDYRKKIEAIRLDIEKNHFQTEKDIDELVLQAELAGTAYAAHQRELAARKQENVKFIDAAATEEITIVSHTFSERLRAKKSKTELQKSAATAKYNAQIEQEKASGKKEIDPEVAKAKAIEVQRMKAYIAGKPLVEVYAIGGSDSQQPSQAVAFLDRFTFDFGK
jgi:hypothetical protein